MKQQQTEREEEVHLWEDIARVDFEECLKWVNNLRAYLRCRTHVRAQEKAVIRRLHALRETLDTLELVVVGGDSEKLEFLRWELGIDTWKNEEEKVV